MHAPIHDRHVDVWLLDGSRVVSRYSILDPVETRRAAKLFRVEHRESFAAAHTALRYVLALYLGCRPGDVEFGCGSGGKPVVRAPGPLEFSFARSDDLAIVAVALEPVGIDIERLRDGVWTPALARSAIGNDAGSELRDIDLYRLWVRREAYAKLLGDGIANLATTIPAVVSVRDLDVPDGYVAALCTHTAADARLRSVDYSSAIESDAMR